MNYDAWIYLIIEDMCEAIKSKRNKSKFTAQQRKDIAESILRLVDRKLPDQNNIPHDGYVIIAKSKAYSLTDAKHSDWKAICMATKKIENISDRVFVLIILAGDIPSKFRELRDEIENKARVSCQEIPSVKDRLSRLQIFSRMYLGSDNAAAKVMVKNAFSLSQELQDVDDAIEAQKNIINIADQIEPDFADELLDIFDDDPARRDAKNHAVREIKTLKAKKDLADAIDRECPSKLNVELFPDAAWRNLAALLAGRIETKPVEVLGGYVYSTSSLGLNGLYPALCWYIENAGRKYISRSDANARILPLCECLLVSTELAFAIVGMRQQRNAEKNMIV